MRKLEAAPGAFTHPGGGGPAFGSYAGPLPRIELGKLPLATRVKRRKKWVYLAVASDEVWLSLAVVRMGYATSTFAFAFDLRSGRMLADHAVVGHPGAAEVADDPRAPGVIARFTLGRSKVVVERAGDAWDVRARVGGLDVDAQLDMSVAPPAIAAIASLGDGLWSATEKRVLGAVRGRVVIGGDRRSLDGALGGYDYTQGLMPRHTRWRWAFAMGRATDGSAIAFNVVDGFVGEAECAAFDTTVCPLHEPKILFDVGRPEGPWRLEGDGVDLAFTPGAVHVQKTNLVLVRSRFLQPVGRFRGTLRVGDRDVAVDGLPGVVEDQDVLW